MIEWRDIPGFVGIYEVSSDGRVRTKSGKTTTSTRHGVRVWKQREIKQTFVVNKKGRADARVKLYCDKRQSTHLVSRLVASAFIGNVDGLTVNHKIGDT